MVATSTQEKNQIHAIMLAAGTGSRLSKNNMAHPPKCLLEFEGKSLLHRHIEILTSLGILKLTIVIGYRCEEIIAEAQKFREKILISFELNKEFTMGSLVSLWCTRKTLRSNYPILFMDADVLYHRRIIKLLTSNTKNSVIPYDKVFDLGNEPVKLCLVNQKAVEFGKSINCKYDQIGEWPGFLKLSPLKAATLADYLEEYINMGQTQLPCEEAIRKMLLNSSRDEFDYVDITGIPWIEIDFIEDLDKATFEILPAIKKY
ncbi:MAG: phosphocholine cytidylyltransferase family protein [Pseudomonadota bacterium]|nr:phosphocholine cytidylyltransferase family protein [Pseudomonadota bacterium]